MKPSISMGAPETYSGYVNCDQNSATLGECFKKTDTTRPPESKRRKLEKNLNLEVKKEVVQDEFEHP